MEKNNYLFHDFDDIDFLNLFDPYHREIKKFIVDLDKECTLKAIKKSKIVDFDTSKYSDILNLINSNKCKDILNRIIKEEDTIKFINLLKERDSSFLREVHRGYSIEEIFESVKDNNYHPVLFLELNKKHYIIDGRTRFYCSLFLKQPVKMRMISDTELNKNCK
tara:strand:+ start:86 stop:577 length:492 start_codon:yes stop_codon:yes gene_type:complete